MAFDAALAARVRELLDPRLEWSERRMFGGLAFLLNGNMALAVDGDGLMLRVDPEQQATILAQQDAEPTLMRGRPLRGWINVAASACAEPARLREWVEHAVAYAATLPAK